MAYIPADDDDFRSYDRRSEWALKALLLLIAGLILGSVASLAHTGVEKWLWLGFGVALSISLTTLIALYARMVINFFMLIVVAIAVLFIPWE